MKKKLLSLLLVGSLVASMAAVATASVSADVLEDGSYVPGDNVEATNRYYFAMPDEWYSANATSAGIYWWSGTDACGAVDGTGGSVAWPGYKAQKSDDVDNLYYVDCPEDVPTIVWNNFLDGGTDTEASIYTEAKQAADAQVEFYSSLDMALDPEDPNEEPDGVYTESWLTEMEESYNGDKAALGDYADNFFYDEEYGLGFSFELDNMIYVVDLSKTSENFDGKLTYSGEWYFYFGNGDYGTYPTKEGSEAAGTLKNIADAPATSDEPTTEPTTQPTTTQPTDKPDQPSTDPTSSVGGSSTSDTVKTPGNGNVQTGQASYAIVLLVVLAAVSGVVVFTRKKAE